MNDDIRHVDLHGDRVAYLDVGCGDVLLLVHGMGGSSESWRPVISRLSRHYRVIAPDLLGHGLSAKPRGDYSLGAFAAGLRDLLDELGIAAATVVGHSLGGGIAMQFNYQHPRYCQRLILISSGGLGPDVGLILRLLSAPGAELVMPLMAPRTLLRIGNSLGSSFTAAGLRSPRGAEIWKSYSSFSDRATRHAFLRTLRSVVDYRGQAVSGLHHLRVSSDVPTLFIWGDRDRIIPLGHAYAGQSVRNGSRIEVLSGVGHFPQVESPVEVSDAIDAFLAETEVPVRQGTPSAAHPAVAGGAG